MLGADRALTLLEGILKAAPSAVRVEVTLRAQDGGYTRFARSRVHQSAEESDARVSLRVGLGEQVGIASTNRLDKSSLKVCMEGALRAAEASPPVLALGPQAPPRPIPPLELFDEETAAWGPLERVETLRGIFETKNAGPGGAGATFAGAISTGKEEQVTVNSAGLRAYLAGTYAEVSLIAEGEAEGDYTPSGYASAASRKVGHLDLLGLGERALKKCRLAVHPKALPAGVYPVLLEPPALAEILQWLCYIGLGAQAHLDGRGFMSGRIGEEITGTSFSLWDDGGDPSGFSIPFDFEGNPKCRVSLIEKGVARGVAMDSAQAKRAGGASTGHAVSFDLSAESSPRNLFVAEGEASFEDLPTTLDRGLWVSRFHYVNGYLHSPTCLMTGMTRDGTFWVEDGKVRHAVHNLRFTQGMLEAFRGIRAISKERWCLGSRGEWGPYCVAPAVVLDAFCFTGGTPSS